MATTTVPEKEGNSALLGVVILAVILLSVCMLSVGLSGTKTPAVPVLADAYINSQVYVEHQLKAPDTAKFPYSGDTAAVTIKDLGNHRAEVLAYVDAQNSFGALIRTHYDAVLDWDHADIWKLVSLKFLD